MSAAFADIDITKLKDASRLGKLKYLSWERIIHVKIITKELPSKKHILPAARKGHHKTNHLIYMSSFISWCERKKIKNPLQQSRVSNWTMVRQLNNALFSIEKEYKNLNTKNHKEILRLKKEVQENQSIFKDDKLYARSKETALKLVGGLLAIRDDLREKLHRKEPKDGKSNMSLEREKKELEKVLLGYLQLVGINVTDKTLRKWKNESIKLGYYKGKIEKDNT